MRKIKIVDQGIFPLRNFSVEGLELAPYPVLYVVHGQVVPTLRSGSRLYVGIGASSGQNPRLTLDTYVDCYGTKMSLH